MTTLITLRFVSIFAAYTGLTVLLPAIMFRRILAGRGLSEQFLMCYTFGNFYIINIVFAVQLLHISGFWALVLFTAVSGILIWSRVNRVSLRELCIKTGIICKKILQGSMGMRGALYRVCNRIKAVLKRSVRLFYYKVICNTLQWILVGTVIIALFWIYGRNLLLTYGYCASDIPVHLNWINEMVRGNLFSDGVYPFGFHCMIYYLHTVFRVDTYAILCVFYLVQVFFIHMVLLAVMKLLCRSLYLPYAGVLVYILGNLWANGVAGAYADNYSNWTAQGTWTEHFQKLPLAWMTLLGLEDIPDKKLMSGESIMNLIRIITALILAVLPVAATCCYAKYRGQSGRQMRILLWAHWTVTGLILVGYLCGALSVANWRLSPIVCTAFIVSMAFLRWAITKQKTMQRAAGVLCVPLACFCLLSACNVLLLPTNAEEVNVQYQLTNMLEKQGLTYGYATFWHANAITVISGEKLKVRNVSVNENGVQKATYQTDSRWYEDQPEQKNYFLLLNNAEYQKLDERKDPLLNQAERSFVLTDSNGTTYQVLVFAKNIF